MRGGGEGVVAAGLLAAAVLDPACGDKRGDGALYRFDATANLTGNPVPVGAGLVGDGTEDVFFEFSVYWVVYRVNRLAYGAVETIVDLWTVAVRDNRTGSFQFGEVARGGGLGDFRHPHPLGDGKPGLGAGLAVFEHSQNYLLGPFGEKAFVLSQVRRLRGDEP